VVLHAGAAAVPDGAEAGGTESAPVVDVEPDVDPAQPLTATAIAKDAARPKGRCRAPPRMAPT